MEDKLRFSIKPAYAFAAEHGLGQEVDEIRNMEIEWDSSYTTSLRKGYLLDLFDRRGILDEFNAQVWPLGNAAAGDRERQRLLRIKARYEAFLAGKTPEIADGHESDELLFPLESHLRDFIATNIANIKLHGLKLHLYVDSSGRNGVEYPTEVGPIDVVGAGDDGALVVFELKLGRGPDRAVGQLLRYMGWLTKHRAEGKRVLGVIVAREIDERLKYAVSLIPNITVFEYRMRFDVQQVSLD